MKLEFFQESKVYISPEDMFRKLSEAECCRDCLSYIFIENYLDRYISYAGCNEIISEESKQFIVYACAWIMNEIKKIPGSVMNKYYVDPDAFLEDIIEVGMSRCWKMDKHLALGLCVYLVVHYLADDLPEVLDGYIEGQAIEQIILKLSDEVIDHIDDPVWERFLDKLLDEYDGDEDALFEDNDIPRLRNLVRQRQILPCGYDRM